MEELPPELLYKIMLYLPLVDRLSCSLTCRRWAEAMTSSELVHDVWLDIAGHEMEAARSVLVNAQRHYTKLVLYEAGLSEFDSEFWRKIGANLRVLELKECSWSTPVFHAILQQCTRLESLKLVKNSSHEISIDDFVLPEGACHEKLQDSLSHLRHLHLDIELTAGVLDSLLGLVPNVTSIFLSLTFDRESDFLERLPSILEKNRIIRTAAVIYLEQIGNEGVIKFVEITSATLIKLQIISRGDDTLTRSACDAIVNCTRLRHLNLDGSGSSFDASHLRKLVSNSPDLEALEVDGYENCEDGDMVHLFELKKLRSLSLTDLSGFRSADEFLRSLGDISTLVKLDLSYLDVDSRVMRSLGCLTNLRSLVIYACEDSECFEAICENFERLTNLYLGYVSNLRDTDGMKLCRLKELRFLHFSGNIGLTDLAFEGGVGSRAMKSLSIHGCSLTNAGLESIASHNDRLEELELNYCENITDDGVLALLQKEPRLKRLSVMGNKSMRLERFAALRNFCPRLRRWLIVDPNGHYCRDS